MARTTLYFTAPRAVEVRTEPVPAPRPDEVRVRTIYSAISPGTELLVYRGQVPEEDHELDPVTGQLDYPLAYGYSAVGIVEDVGRAVDAAWVGRRVFAFQPHTSHFCCTPDALIRIPKELDDRAAVFIPNMETAVTLVMDGRPVLGERVIVLGQGVVGLLTTAVLSRFPLSVLATTDLHAPRRAQSLDLGADRAIDPADASADQSLRAILDQAADTSRHHGSGADLIFELTGDPAALNAAIRYAGFESRIVVGSWYGEKRAALDLGSTFHRHRIRIVSSQVSTLASEQRGRWNKARRMHTVMSLIRDVKPEQMITHTANLNNAPEVFRRLDESSQDVLQTVFEYEL